MDKLSVIVPVYQDELSVYDNFLALKRELDKFSDTFHCEFVLVNDGSSDNSLLVLEQIHAEYPELVAIINFTRNFGQVAAIFAGLAQCSGDCAAVISSDLQDPPELIPRMYDEWVKGARTVIGVRQSREDSFFVKHSSRMFYRLLQRYALPSIPSTGFDFFLLDRVVIQRVLDFPERNSFLQGRVLFASGKVAHLPYARRARKIGRSGWTLFKKLKYFADGFVAYSFTPIRFISALGILAFFLAVLFSAALIVQRFAFGTEAPGWSSVMIALLLLHGFELLAIGIVGEYVWRTLDQSRGRPLYIVDYCKRPMRKEE